MAQNTAQVNMNGVMTAPLSLAFLATLSGLSLELKTMLLSIMAAQDVRQLQAIRSSGRFHNIILLQNNYDIVQYAFNSKNPLYRTANRLYYSFYRPLNPGLNYLFRIAQRCDIAKELAVALAAQLQKTHYSNSSDSQLPTADSYNRETVYRIYALYHMLKQILDQRLDDPLHQISKIALDTLLNIPGTEYSDCIDVFTFGGLEAVKDVMVQPTIAGRLGIVEDHFSRALPDSIARAHALPPSTLPEIDRAAAVKICRLLPPRLFQVLDIDNLSTGGV